MGKISIIAGIEKTVSSCSMGSKTLCSPLVGGKTTNHNQLKNSRSTERVHNLKKIRQVRSVKEHWSPSLPAIGNWWDPAGWKSRYCLNDKDGLLTVLTKPDNLAYKSNHLTTGRTPNFRASEPEQKPHGNIINNMQSSPQTCACTHRALSFTVSEWTNWKVKKLDDIDARNIITSLCDSSFLHGNLQLSLAKPENDKYDTCDKEQHNLQQLIKHSGLA